MGSNATAKAPQVFSLGCQEVKPRDPEGSFPMDLFLTAPGSGSSKASRCLSSDSSCPLGNVQESLTHTAQWTHSTRIQKASIPMKPSSIYQQNQTLCICRYLHWFPSHLKHHFIQGLKSPTKQRMSLNETSCCSCLIKIYKYPHFIPIAILL